MTGANKIKVPKDSLLFEYPMQENIRSYLRLESLFKQFQKNQLASDKNNHFHALKILFEILEILERGDTRAELIKELSRLLDYFQKLEANPEVDTSKLSNFLKKIKQLHLWTNNYQGKFGESIRKHPFIETVKHRTSIPGGSCSFDCPDLHLFLNKPPDIRRQELTLWMADIKGVETSVDVILRLIREKGQWQTENAPIGSFILETSEHPLKLLRLRNMGLFFRWVIL